MPLLCGIVGLPNIGKSTLFNALTSAHAEVSNYPFCTVKPNIGIVNIPDERLDKIFKLIKTAKIVPSTLEFFDIAGLVEGASKGEGLGNQFLSQIRETDAILHIVRCFEDENIAHSCGKIDPAHDIEIVNTELILADLQTVEKLMLRNKKQAKAGDKKAAQENGLCEKILARLEQGKPANSADISKDDLHIVKTFNLLTSKPVVYVANVSEDQLSKDDPIIDNMKQYLSKEGHTFVKMCAKDEAELLDLPAEERAQYRKELGIEDSGLEKLIHESYKTLGLISYYSYNEKELHSWTISTGTKAPQAAGKIHTDFEKGFIRAEVIHYKDFIEQDGEHGAKAKGLLKIEGKEYIVQDGDIILFRFNT